MNWFEVDREGLSKLLARKSEANGIVGPAWLLFELIQNSWDTDAPHIEVRTNTVPNHSLVKLSITDDSKEGFKDLSHSWTLFAESEKKKDPTKRGRFNLGEKLVLALCEDAEIVTTTGTVRFDKEGRHQSRKTSAFGTTFRATLRMTREDLKGMDHAVRLLIPPYNKSTFYNGQEIPQRTSLRTFTAKLPTEEADMEGILRRRTRLTQVTLHAPIQGEAPMLYEMGIPVVELDGGEPFHINVHQKAPLNTDRDNVTPGYLRELRAIVFNAAHDLIKGKEAASEAWVVDAISSEQASENAVLHAKTERFGTNALSWDPSDKEANHKAVAEGYTVIPGGSLPKAAWVNLRKFEVVQPAGQVFPTNLKSVPGTTLQEHELTRGMREVRSLVYYLANICIDGPIDVSFYTSPRATVQADWGNRHLRFNVTKLGEEWFAEGPTEDQVSLIIHEFGHHFESNHLSERYYHALTDLGAKIALNFRRQDAPVWSREDSAQPPKSVSKTF